MSCLYLQTGGMLNPLNNTFFIVRGVIGDQCPFLGNASLTQKIKRVKTVLIKLEFDFQNSILQKLYFISKILQETSQIR